MEIIFLKTKVSCSNIGFSFSSLFFFFYPSLRGEKKVLLKLPSMAQR